MSLYYVVTVIASIVLQKIAFILVQSAKIKRVLIKHSLYPLPQAHIMPYFAFLLLKGIFYQ
jgi:hypothetical protein